jgi:glycosyltransferase involved in cell wall biosynthesis
LKKIIYITPHLSTGGCPKYLQLKVEYFINEYQIWVVEWSDITGSVFVVQKEKIREIIGQNLITLGENKEEILSTISDIQPDYIHFEEIAEDFISYSLLKKIWSPNRNYKILETTHSSFTSISNKSFLPDRWVFPSEFSVEKFSINSGPECVVWEAPILDKNNINKSMAREKLGMSLNFIHVLHVGLFTPGKNQQEIFEIAKKFIGMDIQFHFVGNLADNFKPYWQDLVSKTPGNCRIWGERNDVDLFYEACDVFYFPSTYELNPLSVKEALSWKLPTFLRRLHTYHGKYDTNNLVTYIDENIEENYKKLLQKIISIKNESVL